MTSSMTWNYCISSSKHTEVLVCFYHVNLHIALSRSWQLVQYFSKCSTFLGEDFQNSSIRNKDRRKAQILNIFELERLQSAMTVLLDLRQLLNLQGSFALLTKYEVICELALGYILDIQDIDWAYIDCHWSSAIKTLVLQCAGPGSNRIGNCHPKIRLPSSAIPSSTDSYGGQMGRVMSESTG